MTALFIRDKDWKSYEDIFADRNHEGQMQYWTCDESEDELRIELEDISQSQMKQLMDMTNEDLFGYTYLILWK